MVLGRVGDERWPRMCGTMGPRYDRMAGIADEIRRVSAAVRGQSLRSP
jgi:hypothetical protein